MPNTLPAQTARILIGFEGAKIPEDSIESAVLATMAVIAKDVTSKHPDLNVEKKDNTIRINYQIVHDDGERIKSITLGLNEALMDSLAGIAEMFEGPHRLVMIAQTRWDNVSDLEGVTTFESFPERPTFIHVKGSAKIIHHDGLVINLNPTIHDSKKTEQELLSIVESTLKTFYGPGWHGYDKPAEKPQ